ncbi:MAG: asparagine synthase (glutamine-hydrolyzing) [Burkholderiaceae bacterium]|uniref:asparagine synthase (glutamine-hydrolyzing) n=1 Tax=Denitratimonas sp. CY0512 TaxID=3131940 RepID=UPI0030AD80D3
MCGIAGIIGSPVDSCVLGAMLDAEIHRGPDGYGVWEMVLDQDKHILLGHRRLSILDLSDAGAQPMRDASGDFVLTYNGEIYNYLEVRAELVALGAVFRSHTDTEVLLEAYKRWGTDCLQRFNGMFAFVLYDRLRGVLFCARDRYGEKPFLFGVGRDFFAFASEYKALLQHPGLSLDYDELRLVRAAYRPSTGLDGDRQTVFNDVQQLLPGEAMEVDVRTLKRRIWQYWALQPGSGGVVLDEREVFTHFRELLVDAVRLRMRSDVPVGSCLSGGLDSSAIVCIARQLLGQDADYHTFTGRFPGTAADEWVYASQVVDATGVHSHVVEPTVDGFIAELPTFVWYNELPVGSSSQYAQWNVFRLASQHGVTVLLDGQGADETLGGYEQYFARYVEALREQGDSRRLARELPRIRERYPLALVPPARALRDRLPFRVRHVLSNRLGIGTSLLYGLRPGLAHQVANDAALPRLSSFNPLASALAQDTFGRYLTTLLRYGDRNSMAHSREVRLPFCDHRIAEFVASLPPHLLMGEIQTKRLLRESMRGILPEGIRTRWNKQGFRPPQDLWFQSPALLAQVRDIFNSAAFRDSPYWIAGWWQRALGRVEQGELGLGWTLWHPFMVEQWKLHFLEPLRASRERMQQEQP